MLAALLRFIGFAGDYVGVYLKNSAVGNQTVSIQTFFRSLGPAGEAVKGAFDEHPALVIAGVVLGAIAAVVWGPALATLVAGVGASLLAETAVAATISSLAAIPFITTAYEVGVGVLISEGVQLTLNLVGGEFFAASHATIPTKLLGQNYNLLSTSPIFSQKGEVYINTVVDPASSSTETTFTINQTVLISRSTFRLLEPSSSRSRLRVSNRSSILEASGLRPPLRPSCGIHRRNKRRRLSSILRQIA